MTDSAFPRWYRIAGWVTFPFAAAFILHITYEESYLSWVHGSWQNSFSLFHLFPGLFTLGVFGLLTMDLWWLGAIVIAIKRRSQLQTKEWFQLALFGGFLIIDLVPIDWWQRMMNTLFGA